MSREAGSAWLASDFTSCSICPNQDGICSRWLPRLAFVLSLSPSAEAVPVVVPGFLPLVAAEAGPVAGPADVNAIGDLLDRHRVPAGIGL